jgi:hypothetical protein
MRQTGGLALGAPALSCGVGLSVALRASSPLPTAPVLAKCRKRVAARGRTSLRLPLRVKLAEACLARLGEDGTMVIGRQIGVRYSGDLARFQFTVVQRCVSSELVNSALLGRVIVATPRINNRGSVD